MRSQRFGLWMIAASLGVVLLTAGLLFGRQAAAQHSRTQAQGSGLVRMMSRMPYAQLVPHPGDPGALRAALQGFGDEIGYGIVEDVQGRAAARTGPIDTSLVPALARAQDPASWFGVREVAAGTGGTLVREFYGPLLDKGAVAGRIRLGFAVPTSMQMVREHLSFAALVALPIFLLVPVCQLLMRREMRPLHRLVDRLDAMDDDESTVAAPATPVAPDDLRGVVERLDAFVEAAQARMRQLDSERFDTLVSSRMLAYEQEKADAALQALPDAVMVLDAAGMVLFANAKIAPILAVDHDGPLVGLRAAEVVGSPEAGALLARCGERAVRGMRPEHAEFAPAGTPDRTISVGTYPLASPRDASTVLGTLVVLRDITQERLARAAGAEFVAHVSHELKSPLNVMLMNSELLQSDLADSVELRTETVNVIHDEAQRMASLIDNLLNVSRLEAGTVALDRQRVRLHELLRDVFDEVALNAAGQSIRFEYDVPDEIGPLLLDKGLLRIAIGNLLTNAIKYNRPGGTVELSAEETDSHVVVRVRDSGIGIAPADQARVFDKFFRSADAAAQARGGHGLGLYLSREICALHQGELTVDSEAGRGTEFTMRLRKTSALVQEAARL